MMDSILLSKDSITRGRIRGQKGIIKEDVENAGVDDDPQLILMRDVSEHIFENFQSPTLREIKKKMRLEEINLIDLKLKTKFSDLIEPET